MNSRESQDPIDEYLRGDSELSQQYREISDEEPPRRLDARILGTARRAIKPQRRFALLFPERWMLPLATAATLVLAAGVVTVMAPWSKPREATVPAEAEPPSAESYRSLAEPTADNARGLPKARRDGQQGPEAAGRLHAEEDRESGEVLPAEKTSPASAAPMSAADRNNEAAAARGSAEAIGIDDDALPRNESLGTSKDALMEMQQRTQGEQLEDRSSVGTNGLLRKQRHRFESPEPWLAHIEELRREGRYDEAEQSLADFRQAFPRYPLDSIEKLPEQ